ncbi:MAG TPA: thiopeptide-type bacteriocin biosynthesis protein [Candidatus Saccharimonadales bacterium]|nr:thiopeptide-type bacteriocin biosynthesis protein [Candidatus Saccharimonadales bacterium]
MPSPSGLQIVIPSPNGSWEEILRRAVTPLARELRGHPELGAFGFARYNKPAFHLGVTVLGDDAWLKSKARPAAERCVASMAGKGLFAEYTIGAYEQDTETYGGEEGARLAERFSHHDSLACLDLMEAETRGGRRSRREYSLLMVEAMLGHLGFDRARRVAFYERGFSWAIRIGSLNEEEIAALERRYRDVGEGLAALVSGSMDDATRWGGSEAAEIAARWTAGTAPVLEETRAAHEAGRIRQELGELAWSWARLNSNRLGVLNVAEASLRFFMHRLHADGKSGVD